MEMIDDSATVARLMDDMHSYLPMPAYPTKDLARTLRRRE
jgi:hypothetical protein